MGKYLVSMDFKHDGEWVRPDDAIELSDEAARTRLVDGHIRRLPGATVPGGPMGDPATGQNADDAQRRQESPGKK